MDYLNYNSNNDEKNYLKNNNLIKHTFKTLKESILYVATFNGEFLAISYQTGEILWKLNDKFEVYCQAQYCVDENKTYNYTQSNQVNDLIFKSKNSSKLLFENNKNITEENNIDYDKKSNIVKNEYMVPSIDGLIYHFVDNNYKILNNNNRNNNENISLNSRNKIQTISNLLLIGINPLTGYIHYECNGNICTYSKTNHNESKYYMNHHLRNKKIIDTSIQDILSIECQIFRRINTNLINGKINWNITHNSYQLRYFDQQGYCNDYNYYQNDNGTNDFINLIKYDAINDIIENIQYNWNITLNSPIVGLWYLKQNNKLDKINIRSIIYFSQSKNIVNKILYERKLNEDSLIIFTFNGQPYFVPIINIFNNQNKITNYFVTIYTINDISNKQFNRNNKFIFTSNNNSLQKFDFSNNIQSKLNSFYKIRSYNFSEKLILNQNYQISQSNDIKESSWSLLNWIFETLHLLKICGIFGTAITIIYNTTYIYVRRTFDCFKRNPEYSPLTVRKGSLPSHFNQENDNLINKSFSSNQDISPIMVSRYMTDFIHIKKLGKGGFGHVYMAKNIIDDCEYAIKRIRLPECSGARQRVMREVQALAKLNHPNIVRFYNAWFEPTISIKIDNKNKQIPLCPVIQNDSDLSIDESSLSEISKSKNFKVDINNPFVIPESYVYEEEQSTINSQDPIKIIDDQCMINCNHNIYSDLYIQMQLCQSETLHDWLMSNTINRDISLCLGYFKQILEAICFIHSKNFIHRDLKPSNIFFSMDGQIKIGDFGLVTHTIPSNKYYKNKTKTKLLKNENENDKKNQNKNIDDQNSRILVSYTSDKIELHYYTKQVGTALYMAPEQVKCQKYDFTVDIYALGLVLVELMLPFNTQSERITTLSEIKEGIRISEFEDKYPTVTQLVKWMLTCDPKKRPTASDIISSSLIESLWKKYNVLIT